MKKHILYLIIGISFLIIPTTIYLVFLVPKLSEEYNILMTSGGVLGAFGYYGSTRIPDKLKYSGIVKMASKSYTTVVVGLLIQEFLPQIIGLLAVIVTSVIIFVIFKEMYKNERRKLENKELSSEITRGVTEALK